MITLVSTAIFLAAVCLIARLAPIWSVRHRGCDAYYFLLTAEAFKQKKRLPIHLPGYYLAEPKEQSYPPGFSVFLGLLPNGFLQNCYWLISPALDTVNLLVLFFFLYAYEGLMAGVIAALFYLVIPDLAVENASLTSRTLGNLLLSGYFIGLLAYEQSGGFHWLSLSVLMGSAILMTHKMTMQFLLVFSVAYSLLTWQVVPLALLAVSFAFPFVLLRGFYVEVVRAHFDIVTFWHKHLKHLGAHAIYDSPVYGNPAKSSRRSLFQQPLWVLIGQVLGRNPLLVGLPVIFFFISNQIPLIRGLWYWATICSLWALATLVSPLLRQFGEAHKYVKMSAFPSAALYGLVLTEPGAVALKAALAGLGVLAIAKMLRNAYVERRAPHAFANVLDDDLREAFAAIKERDFDYILCLDYFPSDSLVYHCRRHVLWGTHGYGFNTDVVNFYPVLRQPLEFLMRKYGIKYLLLDQQFARPEDLRLSHEQLVWRGRRYGIYDLRVANP